MPFYSRQGVVKSLKGGIYELTTVDCEEKNITLKKLKGEMNKAEKKHNFNLNTDQGISDAIDAVWREYELRSKEKKGKKEKNRQAMKRSQFFMVLMCQALFSRRH